VDTRQGERAISIDPDADDLWEAVYYAIPQDPGAFGAVTGRAAPHILRLALIYASLDRSTAIRVPHLKAALEVWRYSEDSARFIFGDQTGNAEADAILFALREAGDHGLTRTESRTTSSASTRPRTASNAHCDRSPPAGSPPARGSRRGENPSSAGSARRFDDERSRHILFRS
jgi:hypothetical protein